MAKKTGLILAGLALAGFGVYEYMKKRNGQLVSVTTVTNDQPPTQLSYPTTGQPSQPADAVVIRDSSPVSSAGRPFDPSSGRPVSNTGDSSSTSITAVGADNTPITSTVNTAVMNWVNADGRPPIVAMGQARIPSEFNGMYAIIAGGWNPTDDQRLFWNQLIAKYDPQHKYL